MKRFVNGMRWGRKALFDLRTVITVVGLLMSVVLHELFHIIVHWGHIVRIQIFPDSGAIMEVTSLTQKGYDPQVEEGIAYLITMVTMLITAALVFTIHDKRDTRSFTQTVFPKNTDMQSLSRRELLQLAGRIHLL